MTTNDVEVVTGELVPAEPTDNYAAPLTLFGTSDPEVALERMAKIARLLVGVVRERRLVKRISGSEYLLAPAWTVLGGMTGVVPYTVWTRPLEDGTGYMARVEARRVADGARLSAAEQVCTRSETKWAHADEHELIGMAQTRAQNRALRGPLMQIVELAGYKSTPAEEMPDGAAPRRAAAGASPILPAIRPTNEQKARVRELLAHLAETDASTDWAERARQVAGCPSDHLTATIMSQVIEKLGAELQERRAERESPPV
jgi:hypothetical protein